MVHLCVSCNPQLSTVQEEFEQQVPSVFPRVLYIARAMVQKRNKKTPMVGVDDNRAQCGHKSVEGDD